MDMCISSSYIPQSSNNFLNIHQLKIEMYWKRTIYDVSEHLVFSPYISSQQYEIQNL